MPDSVPSYVPTKADELNHMGAVMLTQGHYEPARLHFLAALSLEPEHVMALQNLGAVLRQLRHYDAAESVAKRSVLLTEGRNPHCISNLGVSQLGLRKYDEALVTLKSVLKALPNANSWHNYGLICYMMGQLPEALAAFNTSLEMEPNSAQCQSDRSLTLLSLGDIQQGLEAYEVRWNLLFQCIAWKLGIEEWKGQSLDGKHLLIHHEQGFGDTIMLSRFVDTVAQQHPECKITLAVPSELMRLCAQSFPNVDVIDWQEAEAFNNPSQFDYHSPLLSVMRHVGVAKYDDICSAPYLRAVPRREVRLPDTNFRIGVCWASGNHSPLTLERRRVVPVTHFLPLTEMRGVGIVSLQKGAGSEDIVQHGLEGIIFDATHRIEDFADTAEIIACLDLVISVDSAVAHLAGALGKPCIMLSPYTRCWRWWSNKSGWPWYRGMQQFHQSQDGSWGPAMNRTLQTVRGIVHRHMG